MDYLSDNEFLRLKQLYNEINDSFSRSLVFHVGTCAGLYSELGNLLECILYCYNKKIRFVLYADDANFTIGCDSNEIMRGGGWNEFFEPFCPESHYWLNRYVNRRYKRNHKYSRVIDNVFCRYLKIKERCHYLTQDVFYSSISADFKQQHVEWSEMKISGTVWPEYIKLMPLVMRYNKRTKEEIEKLISELNLPSGYLSVQIRGGDKTMEVDRLLGVEDFLWTVEKENVMIDNLFVFTDDYENIKILRGMRPQWHIYTLTHAEEHGYNNAKFQQMTWEFKRNNLVKLFAMVEICLASSLHIGDENSCANNIIRAKKLYDNTYLPMYKLDE